MTTPGKALSLGFELDALGGALEGVHVLAEALRDEQLDEDEIQRLPTVLVAQLALMIGRLRYIRRAIRGDVDPAELLGRHNRVDIVQSETQDPDLRLGVWGDDERAEHARHELRRAGVTAAHSAGRERKGRKR